MCSKQFRMAFMRIISAALSIPYEQSLSKRFFRADALRQAATTLVDGVRGTSQAAMLSSAKVRVARMQAEEECAGLELTSLQPRSGELQLGSGAPSIGSDLTGEKLADRLNRIHSRMDDVLPLVAKAREYLAVIREQLPPRTTPQQLLVVVNPGTSSTISDISREAQPEGQAKRPRWRTRCHLYSISTGVLESIGDRQRAGKIMGVQGNVRR
ncbi:hypothetical protein R3P38DRAFT_805023 [Favolaschia claudopus]|uniref:Uncharacterized protein n=1 Tax=Favolaschia claudopus TaxID=2862362 RepID=A0AAV9Z2B0_9AGAR